MPALTDDISALPLPGSDVGSTPGSASDISLGQSVYGRLDSSADSDWYEIRLVAGRTYDFRLLGVGHTPLTDPWVELRDGAGTLITSNDDGLGDFAVNSNLTYTATTTGIYYVSADGFGGSAGDFLLTVAANNVNGPVFTAHEVAWQLTNNFERFFSDGWNNVTTNAYNVSGARQITYNITGLTAQGAALAVQALQQWSDVTGISFIAAQAGSAQITFANTDAGTNAYNSNTTDGNGTTTSSYLMLTTGWLDQFGTTLDSYSFETYIHELGHALGLGHGGNYNGSATYGTDNFYLNDSQHLSIMSYMQSQHDEFADAPSFGYNTFVDAQFRWVLTPMIADILAMRNLYGLSTTTRTGNTTYGYNSNTGNAALDAAVTLNDPANNNYVAFTIFDNGGTDTVNMSGFAGAQRIDLNGGASSNVLGGRLNMGIAYGTVVENAIGGSGGDVIIGNAAANRLTGGGGRDNLFGGAGADKLFGGASNDVLNGGVGNDEMTGNAGADAFVFNAMGAANADTIFGYVRADDVIRLDHRAFDELDTGVLAAAAFRANLTGIAGDASDRIIYETDTGRLFYDSDGNGAAGRFLFATIANHATLANTEFVVI